MLGVVVLYLGLLAAFLGGVSLLRPLSFLAIRTRRQAALFLTLGFILVVVGGSLPVREARVAAPRRAPNLISLRPSTSSVSSTPLGSRRQKSRCIAPLS